MNQLSNKTVASRPSRPIKFIQFGEGNFLRAFVDWMIQEMNNAGIITGDVAVVQPVPFGRLKELKEQDGLYTLIQEGVTEGEFVSQEQIIDVISEFNNPYEDFSGYLKLAEIETLEYMISNTTEAGIVLDEQDDILATPPATFPAKVLAFLKHRYEFFNGDMEKGLYIIPCELIDHNGDELYRCVKRLAEINNLDAGFMNWLEQANTFTNTLVDRIVPGYPAGRMEEFTCKLGYTDNNLVLGEVFHLWVIEDRNGISSKLAGNKAGLNMVFTDDIKPYKLQKVRILNGLHTLMVPTAFLKGLNTVYDAMNDKEMFEYIKEATEQELIPATENYLSKEVLTDFAASVYDRFNNPQANHELLSIALNATSKFKSRLLPTGLDYLNIHGEFPKRMALSLASNLVFFRGVRGEETIRLQDDQQFLDFYKDVWSKYEAKEISAAEVVDAYLGLKDHWGMDLNEIPSLKETVTASVETLLSEGVEAALKIS